MRFSFKKQCFRQDIPSNTSPAYLWFSFKEQCFRQHIPSHTPPVYLRFSFKEQSFRQHIPSHTSPAYLRFSFKEGCFEKPIALQTGDEDGVVRSQAVISWWHAVSLAAWRHLCHADHKHPICGRERERKLTALCCQRNEENTSLNKGVQEVGGEGGGCGWALNLAHYWCRFKSLVQQGIFFFKPTFSADSLTAFWYFSSLFLYTHHLYTHHLIHFHLYTHHLIHFQLYTHQLYTHQLIHFHLYTHHLKHFRLYTYHQYTHHLKHFQLYTHHQLHFQPTWQVEGSVDLHPQADLEAVAHAASKTEVACGLRGRQLCLDVQPLLKPVLQCCITTTCSNGNGAHAEHYTPLPLNLASADIPSLLRASGDPWAAQVAKYMSDPGNQHNNGLHQDQIFSRSIEGKKPVLNCWGVMHALIWKTLKQIKFDRKKEEKKEREIRFLITPLLGNTNLTSIQEGLGRAVGSL